MVRQINLTESNSRKLDQLSNQTGKTPDEVANEAIGCFAVATDSEEEAKFQRWREALLRLEGMWENRDDLPDFEALRKTWDRNLWSK